jgi:hypothetical protein
MHPLLMEALQMLKFSLKQKRLDFMQGWITPDYDMRGAVHDEPDLLAGLANGGSVDELLAAVIRDDEISSK